MKSAGRKGVHRGVPGGIVAERFRCRGHQILLLQAVVLRGPFVAERGRGGAEDEALVHALTFACEKVYEKAPESVAALDQALRTPRWDIFMRIRQHLYSLHPNEQTKPWIRELILVHEYFDKWEHQFEFKLMIRLACEKLGSDLLSKTEKKHIFEAILSGPSEQDFRDGMGDRYTRELFEERKHHFHRMQLRPFASVLLGEYSEYFDKLNAEEEQPITDDDYMPYRSGEFKRVQKRSPILADELKKMSDEKILSFLNEWENIDYDPYKSLEINFEGLAQAFQSIFKEVIIPDDSRLQFWIENLDRLERPIYVEAIVSVIQEFVRSKQFDKLDQWFDLCEWILTHPDQPKVEGVKRSDESKEHPDWGNSRRAVCDLIEVFLKRGVGLPKSFHGQIQRLLEMLCTQYDRHLDQKKPVLSDRDDPFTEAINTTRGRALEHLVDFGYWVRRRDDKADVPELKTILDKRFRSESKYSLTLPEHALLGMLYRRIYGLDEKWAIARKSAFFPQSNLHAWREAFGNFLRHHSPNQPIFNVLCDNFEFSLDNLKYLKQQKGFSGKSAQDFFGQHLFTYYMWDIYPLKGAESLLERYYQKTISDREHWAKLFGHLGRSLRNTKQLDSNFKERIYAFFDWRLKIGELSELQKFVYWIKADCLEAEWRLNAYSRILDLLQNRGVDQWTEQSAHISSIAIHSIREMLPMCTYGVVECFAKLTDSMPKSAVVYLLTNDAKAILKAGLDHGDEIVREKAREARENLLSRGFLSVLDLDN